MMTKSKTETTANQPEFEQIMYSAIRKTENLVIKNLFLRPDGVAQW
jgi:hypothetical protein